jgi:hypothetical protein
MQHDLDPSSLSNSDLASLYTTHAQALKASRIIFEKSVALAMAATEYGGEANRIGFQEWSVENMDAIQGWRETPTVRRNYNILSEEMIRRFGK